MAKSRRLVANPAVRSLIRSGIRDGQSDSEILDSVAFYFDTQDQTEAASEIRAERRRQNLVDEVMEGDKRRNVDLGRRLGCRGRNARARWGIEIFWVDPNTNESRRFHWTGESAVRGRLADLINEVIQQAIAHAMSMGYLPPRITSANTAGSTSYRLNYVECV